MKIVSVDQSNSHVGALERLRAAQAAESRANDDHSGPIPGSQFAATRNWKKATVPPLRQSVDRQHASAVNGEDDKEHQQVDQIAEAGIDHRVREYAEQQQH